MFTEFDAIIIGLCIEWFFYGKISILCALTCTLAKKVQLFPGLGLYSGIFAIYFNRQLEHPQNNLKSKTAASIVFYALCVLYVLSTFNVVLDLLTIIEEVSINPICKNIIFLNSVFFINDRRTKCHSNFLL
jgi:hypothetical protein